MDAEAAEMAKGGDTYEGSLEDGYDLITVFSAQGGLPVVFIY